MSLLDGVFGAVSAVSKAVSKAVTGAGNYISRAATSAVNTGRSLVDRKSVV